MILDTLANADRSFPLHPLFAQAFAFARRPAAAGLPDGRHAIVDDRLYAVASHGVGRPQAEALLEGHRRYIDIQLVLGGSDLIGWAPLADVAATATTDGYKAPDDIIFFTKPAKLWLPVLPGQFAIFFPEDAHAPLANTGVAVHKLILKVAIE